MKKSLFLAFALLMNLSTYAMSSMKSSFQSFNDTIIVIKKKFDTAFFIPDGPRCLTQCYQTGIMVDAFPQNAVVRTALDVASLCMTMEHSFSGDLRITLICPNGQKATLMKYNGTAQPHGGPPPTPPYNGGADFGIALMDGQRKIITPGVSNDDYQCVDSLNAQGTGWQYCWSERYLNNTKGPIGPHTRNNQPIIDSSDYNNRSGFFTPDSAFSKLIGCSLNGEWKIEVCDYWAADKGWLFEWSLGLGMEAIVPEGFAVAEVTQNESHITCENNENKAFFFEYKKENEAEWSTPKAMFSSQIDLADLEPNTKYQIRAYSFLGDGLTKLESEIDSFKTVCHIPNMTVSSITENGAIITFENGDGKEFGFEYKKEGDTEWISQIISCSQIELGGLEPDTKYEIRTCCISLKNEFNRANATTDEFTTKVSSGLNNTTSGKALFEIYPNPAKDFITAKLQGIPGLVTIEILDMNGTCLKTQKVIGQTNEKEYNISVANLLRGTYLIRISHDGHVKTKKIIIQ